MAAFSHRGFWVRYTYRVDKIEVTIEHSLLKPITMILQFPLTVKGEQQTVTLSKKVIDAVLDLVEK